MFSYFFTPRLLFVISGIIPLSPAPPPPPPLTLFFLFLLVLLLSSH